MMHHLLVAVQMSTSCTQSYIQSPTNSHPREHLPNKKASVVRDAMKFATSLSGVAPYFQMLTRCLGTAISFCGGVLFGQGPSSSAEVRGLVIHDIKEVDGVRQQDEQEDKREREREVEEVRRDAQHTHET